MAGREGRREPNALHALAALGLAFFFFIAALFLGQGADPFIAIALPQIGFLGAALITFRLARLDPAALRLVAPKPLRLAAAVVGGVSLTVALAQLAPLQDPIWRELGWDFSEDIRRLTDLIARLKGRSVILTYVVAALLPALCEEALFRAILLPGFCKSLGRPTGLIVTTLVFAIAHFVVPQAVMVFLIGLYIGGMVMLTGSWWSGVAIHFCNNALALTLSDPGRPSWSLFAGAAMVAGGCLAFNASRPKKETP